VTRAVEVLIDVRPEFPPYVVHAAATGAAATGAVVTEVGADTAVVGATVVDDEEVRAEPVGAPQAAVRARRMSRQP